MFFCLLTSVANNILFAADWRREVERVTTSAVSAERRAERRDVVGEAASVFCATLKVAATVGYERRDEGPGDDVVNREDTLVTEDTVMYIVNKIKKNKEQRMRLYAKLGAELAGLKNNYMVDKCPKCFVNPDIYKVITCQKCVKVNNIKIFYNRMKELTRYEKDYVCFIISFSSLCSEFPKLSYACCSMYKLKKYLSAIKKMMKAQVEFWSV